MEPSFSWLVIAGAALAAWVIGALWYSVLFAKPWIKAHGYSEDQLKAMAANAPKAYGGSFVAMFITATVFSLFLQHLGVDHGHKGAWWGFHVWLGFAMPLGLTANLYSDKKIATFFIDTAYQLVYLLAMGFILGRWGSGHA